jgi:hypothetical protein
VREDDVGSLRRRDIRIENLDDEHSDRTADYLTSNKTRDR